MSTYFTSDISLTAFLLMKGMRILTAQKHGNRFEFLLDCKGLSTQELVDEYISSEYPKYDASMRVLKKRLYGQQSPVR